MREKKNLKAPAASQNCRLWLIRQTRTETTKLIIVIMDIWRNSSLFKLKKFHPDTAYSSLRKGKDLCNTSTENLFKKFISIILHVKFFSPCLLSSLQVSVMYSDISMCLALQIHTEQVTQGSCNQICATGCHFAEL